MQNYPSDIIGINFGDSLMIREPKLLSSLQSMSFY